jgi:hypothetical protein
MTDTPSVRALHPGKARLQRMSDEDRVIVSEPVSILPGAWREVPESTALIIQPGADEQHEFCPRRPPSRAGRPDTAARRSRRRDARQRERHRTRVRGAGRDDPGPAHLAAGQFLMTLDTSVMNVAIATVAEDVGTDVTGIQTAITLYTLVMATLTITGGKVGA